MIGEAIGGLDMSKLREGGDATGYVFGFWAQPALEALLQWDVRPCGASTPLRDEYGYVVTKAPPDRAIFRVAEVGEISQSPGVTLQDVIAAIAARAKAWGVTTIAADDFESAGVGALLTQHEIRRFIPYAWSQPSKEEAISTLRRMIRERTLSIVPDDGLRKEMLGLRFRVSRSGHIEYQTRGKDMVSALISVAHYFNDPDAVGLADLKARPLEGTPFRAYPGGRFVGSGR